MVILLPALDNVRKQAKSTVCPSNLKQWGWIMMTYVTEYKIVAYLEKGRVMDENITTLLGRYR